MEEILENSSKQTNKKKLKSLLVPWSRDSSVLYQGVGPLSRWEQRGMDILIYILKVVLVGFGASVPAL